MPFVCCVFWSLILRASHANQFLILFHFHLVFDEESYRCAFIKKNHHRKNIVIFFSRLRCYICNLKYLHKTEGWIYIYDNNIICIVSENVSFFLEA